MNKQELSEKILRRLGYPMIKVELDRSQIYDNIDYARNKFIKWAVGQATHETFFTMVLSGGVNFYDLPLGVVDVIDYSADCGDNSGINTLFTVDNFLYSRGMYDGMIRTWNDGYSLISYHIALDFLETLKRYTAAGANPYNWKYHKYTNQLEIHPAPLTGGSLNVLDSNGDTKTIDSPGFVMIKSYMIEGSTYDDWTANSSTDDLFNAQWILDYSEALCKITLGRIRSKFANFTSIGNMGIGLDGDTLLSEGREDKQRLEEELKLEEAYMGMDIIIG